MRQYYAIDTADKRNVTQTNEGYHERITIGLLGELRMFYANGRERKR